MNPHARGSETELAQDLWLARQLIEVGDPGADDSFESGLAILRNLVQVGYEPAAEYLRGLGDRAAAKDAG